MLSFLLLLDTEEDRNFFQELYEKHRNKMLSVVREMIEKKSEAEDVVQDAFITLIIRYHDKYEKLRDMEEGFFVIVAKNKARDHNRKGKKKHEILFGEMLDDYDDELSYDPLDKLANTEEDVVGGDVAEMLVRYIKMLPDKYSEVLERSLIMEMSNNEIAEAMRVSPSVVSTRLSRAKKKLRDLVMGEEADKFGL